MGESKRTQNFRGQVMTQPHKFPAQNFRGLRLFLNNIAWNLSIKKIPRFVLALLEETILG